jgi:elongation factor Ts
MQSPRYAATSAIVNASPYVVRTSFTTWQTSTPMAAVARERDVLAEQAAQSGKPKHVVETMVEGRLNKFYSEVCLLEQPFIIDDSAGSITKVLAAAGKELGADVALTGFVRYRVGESEAGQ